MATPRKPAQKKPVAKPAPLPSRVFLLNLGCSKNQVDAEKILGELGASGVSPVESADEADLIVVNTCGFIESAKAESINETLQLLDAKRKGQKVVMAGCLSQRYRDDLTGEFPEIDLMIGTYKPGELVRALELPAPDAELAKGCLRVGMDGLPHHAFLKIAEGCNRTCAFCAIPGIRGKQVSRTLEEIVAEAQLLQQRGVKELSLVAQDLTFYGREKGGPGSTLEELLRTLLKETDIPWLRLMYAYPAFLGGGLLDLIGAEKRICSYIDIPIQHGSDRMLERMRRGHTREGLRRMLRDIRKRVPDVAIRSTLLLGFPGETEEDYQQLLDLVEEIRFDRLGCFTYSEEEGTPAAEYDDPRVDPDLAAERAERLMGVQARISLERNEALIGQELEVLVDEMAEGTEAHFHARTQWDAPEVDGRVQVMEGNATPGEFARVRIIGAGEYDLDATVV